MPKFDYAVFIGKFSPVHIGHVKVMVQALEKADYLIVVVGSANAARNTRIPFTVSERIRMIQMATDFDERILFTEVDDHPYNESAWLAEVQQAVDEVIEHHAPKANFSSKGWSDYKYNIALAGMFKDSSSYYLALFPQWGNSIAIQPENADGEILSSTGIRNNLFNGNLAYDKDLPVTKSGYDIKRTIIADMEARPEIWNRLQRDWNYEQRYSSLWGNGPHVTVDALVIQAGHILLIQRGAEYGENLWALPGGFLNRREKILDGCIRELREETKLKVPDKVLYGSVKEVKVYDDPWRSNRSHIITHCHKIVLENVKSGLPDIMGSDDAKKAEWVPLSKVAEMYDQFFEDHGAMISDLAF